MCGIAGFWLANSNATCALSDIAVAMANVMEHRGPDGSGCWHDAAAGIAFGHRRLSIIDLSSAGSQPMLSASGRYVITFNGEIYNHSALRADLLNDGYVVDWRGHSDTETLCASFEHWGIETTLTKSVGMFAIAIWDSHQRKLHMARDRFGEKPLYYGWVNGDAKCGPAFVFGSELKALRAFPGFANQVARDALALYLRFMYIPAPRTIYEGIFKLEPGCLLTISERIPTVPSILPRPDCQNGSMTLKRWWSLAKMVQASASGEFNDEAEALFSLEETLQRSVIRQSLADVPWGAFLSGGVDSSTIVALMQKQSMRPVRTFTVGFEEAEFDESIPAKKVAKHLGADHTELFVSASDARDVIPRLAAMYDEPFADSSQIPTHLVCSAARKHVTVALSGDAGDELFGGYNRYIWAPRLWKRLSKIPSPLQRAVMGVFGRILPTHWDRLSSFIEVQRAGEMIAKFAEASHNAHSLDDLYKGLVSAWSDPRQVLRDQDILAEPSSLLSDPLPLAAQQAELRMMYRDSMTYLPDDILCKVDRAAMAASLESRLPYLDHHVAEIAWRLPLSMKIRNGTGKWALRQILYKYVPREMIERPKVGFGIPIGRWLRGPLKNWAENLLDEARLEREGYLNPKVIRDAWAQHLSGRFDWTNRLWAVLMFQAWLEGNS
ncbi:MAG: asparagine synthase (glutamine-hydrolyzing) [Methylocystis sp.]|nr:asparagine synthase (glutamine-hydrolyzing) [Methylocystis sp.]